MPAERRTRLSVGGWFLLSGLAVSAVVSLAFGRSLPCALSMSACLSLLLAWLLGRWNVRHLAVRATMPGRAVVGRLFPVDIVLANGRRRAPGLSYRIADRSTPRMVCGTPRIRCLAPAGEVCLDGEGSVSRRGVYETFQFEICSRFPLGLVETVVAGALPIQLAVLPAPRDIDLLRDARLHGESGAGHVASHRPAQTGELRSLRDYRPGDPIKLISWPASTRRSKAVLRELEHPLPRRIRLLFHSYRPERTVLHSKPFEHALEILCGVLAYARQHGWETSFWADFAPFDAPVLLAPGEHVALDQVIAAAAMARDDGLGTVLGMLQDRHGQDWLTVVVSNCPRRYWESQVVSACRGPLLCLDPQLGGESP